MSKQVKAWATSANKTEEIIITRRAPDDEDVAIDIKFAGICHGDISTVDGTLGEVKFPLVVGHEIAGVVSAVGKNVTKFKAGDHVGVGCMVNSCSNGNVATYNDAKDPKEPGKITQGGYSQYIVVDQAFVLSIPENLPLIKAAPLLCAGITLFSPLNHWNAGPGKKVGIIGLGGLVHVGVKLAKAMGYHVTVFSRTDSKSADIGLKLGADKYIQTDDPIDELKHSFDLIINTLSADISTEPSTLVKQTQEILDFCGEKDIYPEVEVIKVSHIDEASTRVKNSDVNFSFVINIGETTECTSKV